MDAIKTCPKCEGNVFLEWDMSDGDWYEYCIQCAYRHYLPVVVNNLPSHLEPKKKKRKNRKRRQ